MIKTVTCIGIPTAVIQICLSVAASLTNIAAAALPQSDEIIAAYGVVHRLVLTGCYVIMGFMLSLIHLSANQYLINQVRLYLLSNMSAAFQSNPNSHQFKVPREMAAKLYSEAIVIILEWKYLEKRECSKEQAKEYLQQMVSGIDEKQTVSNL